MNYDRPELLDHLAAAYVLGTLGSRARRRFERLCRTLPAAADAVRDWERRLAPLAAPLPPVRPSAQLWRAIEARTVAARTHVAEPAEPAGGARRGGGWFGLAFGFACGLMLAVGLLRLYPEVLVPAAPPADEAALPASYVGLLAAPDGTPMLLASAPRQGRRLTLKLLHPIDAPIGRIAVLWALPSGSAPFVLGTLPVLGRNELELAASAEELLSTVSRLGLSFEADVPAAGARPGAFTLTGHCVKLW